MIISVKEQNKKETKKGRTNQRCRRITPCANDPPGIVPNQNNVSALRLSVLARDNSHSVLECISQILQPAVFTVCRRGFVENAIHMASLLHPR